MYRRLILRSILFLTLIFASIIGYSQGDTLRILSYNILHGATVNNDFNIDLQAGVMKAQNPDLIALQEVDFKTNRAKKMDLVTEYAYRLKMAGLFGEAMPYDGGGYGEGLLSKFNIIESKNHPLPARAGKEPRAALSILVRLKSGDTVQFVGTHLDHTRDPIDRINQAKQLNKLFLSSPYPVILAGDLNATPESAEMEILLKHWKKADSENLGTYPMDGPVKKIDYILVYPPEKWDVINYQVVEEKIGSDHRPVFAEIVLK